MSGESGEVGVQTEERKEAVSCLEGSRLLSPSAFRSILFIIVAFTTLSLSDSPSLIVSFTRLLPFNVISFLSPSHAPLSTTVCHSSSFFHTLCLPLFWSHKLLTFLISLFISLIFLSLQLNLSVSSALLFLLPFFYLALNIYLSLSLPHTLPGSPLPTLDWSQSLPPLMRWDWVLNWALHSQLGHTDWGYGLQEASRRAGHPRPAKVHFNHLVLEQQMAL